VQSYWQKFTRARTSRRRAILAAAGLGLGASTLTLLGCGSDGGSGSSDDKSALVDKPRPSNGKPGGTLKTYTASDIMHFDATADPSATTVPLSSEPFYPRLLKLKAVKYPELADGSSEGEAAESWEMSPDRLTITMKLRQGMKWDARAPTNNRPLDANDVLFSWSKFKALNVLNTSLAYDAAKAPEAPVESITAPDSKTLVVKLNQPDASILALLSARDIFFIEPKEAESGFDPKTTVRGHGPYLLENYTPSAGFTWKKNPDYYVKDRPFFDRVETPIVSDQAQRLAQFRAGNIHTDVLETSQENVVVTKRELPDVLMLQADNFPVASGNMICFGWEAGSPWLDIRMRQALSMMIDHEAFIDAVENRDQFRREGIDLPVSRNSALPAGWGDLYLDPAEPKEFGPNAKFLSLNVAEAKKLIAAAGHPANFAFDIHYGGHYGGNYKQWVEVLAGFFTNGGLQPKLSIITPSSVWLSNYSRIYRAASYKPGSGFNGIAIIPERTYPTAAVQIYNQYHRDGGGYRGMVNTGGSVKDGDAKSTEFATKITQEFDRNKQKTLVHEFIRYEAEQLFYVPRVSVAKTFTLWWPAVGNVGAYTSYPGANNWADVRLNWWLDESKPPLKRA
jgi:ABC-type transport system substrate-binding protein